MFEIDSERTSLPLSPDRVLALVASLNAPMVVAADMPVEPTRGYICAYRDSSDRVAFSIFLHCVESGRGVFYRYDGGSMPQHRVDEVMSEAMAFAESLGFMMDDLGWGSLDATRRNELMRETPIFLEPGARAAAMATGQEGTGTSTDLAFDEATDAGVVGATPISPIPDPPAPVAPSAQVAGTAPSPARAETSGPPGSAAAPSSLRTAFVPPPGAASAQAVSASPAQAGAIPRSAPAGATEPLPARPAASGPHSSIELSIDAPEPVRAPVSPGAQAVSASPAPADATPRSAPAGATTPLPARSEPIAPPGPARPSAAAPHSPIPGATAAAQALVRLLASL